MAEPGATCSNGGDADDCRLRAGNRRFPWHASPSLEETPSKEESFTRFLKTENKIKCKGRWYQFQRSTGIMVTRNKLSMSMFSFLFFPIAAGLSCIPILWVLVRGILLLGCPTTTPPDFLRHAHEQDVHTLWQSKSLSERKMLRQRHRRLRHQLYKRQVQEHRRSKRQNSAFSENNRKCGILSSLTARMNAVQQSMPHHLMNAWPMLYALIIETLQCKLLYPPETELQKCLDIGSQIMITTWLVCCCYYGSAVAVGVVFLLIGKQHCAQHNMCKLVSICLTGICACGAQSPFVAIVWCSVLARRPLFPQRHNKPSLDPDLHPLIQSAPRRDEPRPD